MTSASVVPELAASPEPLVHILSEMPLPPQAQPEPHPFAPQAQPPLHQLTDGNNSNSNVRRRVRPEPSVTDKPRQTRVDAFALHNTFELQSPEPASTGSVIGHHETTQMVVTKTYFITRGGIVFLSLVLLLWSYYLYYTRQPETNCSVLFDCLTQFTNQCKEYRYHSSSSSSSSGTLHLPPVLAPPPH